MQREMRRKNRIRNVDQATAVIASRSPAPPVFSTITRSGTAP